MKKYMFRRFVPIFTFFFLAAFLSAAGRGEDPVRRARELVSANRINEAILLLEQTIRDDPDRIVEAEALMRSIRTIRGEYNVLFELLIDNLVNNPDDITRTLEIIDQMEDLDEFPNQRVLSQVEDARVIAQLAFDRNIVNETMDRARVALLENRYTDAIEKYLSLETRQRAEFDDRGYGDIFVNRVDEAVARINTIADDFVALVEPYQSVARPVVETVRTDAFALNEQEFSSFVAEAARMFAVLERAEELTGNIVVLRSQVPLQFPDQPVDWYLNFREMITRGRGEFRGQEGLEYAIRRLYRDYAVQIAEATETQFASELEAALSLADTDEHGAAARRLDRAERIAEYWRRTEAVLLGVPDGAPDPRGVADRIEGGAGSQYVLADASRRSAASLAELSRSMEPLAMTAADIDFPLDTLIQRKGIARSVVEAVDTGRTAWNEESSLFEEVPGEAMAAEAISILETVSTRRDDAYSSAVTSERDLAVAVARVRTQAVPPVIAAMTGELVQVDPLLDGLEEDIGDDATRIVRYPDEALNRIAAAGDQLDQALQTVTDALDDIEGDAPHVTDGDVVQAEAERLTLLREQITLLQDRAAAAETRATDLIAEAQEWRDQGFQLIADARSAINLQRLDAARDTWEDARDAFFDSLELREDPDFRQEADQLIAVLGQELLELENVIVIQRVRELLTQAEAQYNQDQYIAARDTLLQAQQTWEQTNVDRNSEIDRLLLLSTAALNLEEGRELSPTDPLYPVLGNYLSLAREDFNRAVSLFDEGRESEADRYFDRSIENLRNVRDVRPLNWESRILELRIVQLRDADEFDEIFSARYNQAVARLEQAGPLEVYSEIEVLAEINPDYPGIQQQLRRLEIMLNLRPDPIDQQRISRANQLFQQATGLADGSRDQMSVAVSLLEDAVDLNPGNTNARFLLDQLRIRLGGQATAALSTTDEQQYRRAETLFQQGQVLQALAITERLLSSTANQGYPPLVELRRRIGLRLGI